MKKIGVISYNIYGNFTNYGSALQSFALHKTISKIDGYQPVLIDYCPDILKEKDPLNPEKNAWDNNSEMKKMIDLSMPAIRINLEKFNRFYSERFLRSARKYTSENFNQVIEDENLEGFVCGSDTIFCMEEFGFDDGYYANYDCMKGNAVSYAASFGDPDLNDEKCRILDERLQNFLGFGLREKLMVPYVQEHTGVCVQRVVDPTLLLTAKDFDEIAVSGSLEKEKYLLYYSRRYSPEMEAFVERVAREEQLKVVEISLRAQNKEKGHRMFYEAGVEEFLSLVKHAEYVVTNSYHGMLLSVQYRKPFSIFMREQCNNKIEEVLDLLGLSGRIVSGKNDIIKDMIDYDTVMKKIEAAREESLRFLEYILGLL